MGPEPDKASRTLHLPQLPQVQLDKLLEAVLQGGVSDALGRDRWYQLLEAVLSVGQELDFMQVLGRTVTAAVELMDCEYGALGIVGQDQTITVFVPVGMSQEQIAAIGAYPAGKGVLGELIRHPRPLRLREASRHPAAYGFPPNHPPMHSFLGVPIRVREEVVGNFYLAEKRGGQEFDLEDEAVLQTLAVAAGVAMENARQYQKARKRLQLLYDAATRVGTTLDMVRTAEELARVAVPGFADYTTVELLEAVLQGGEPSATAVMHCTASCGVRQDAPLIPVGERITWLPATPMASALVSGHAVLEPDLGAAPGWQTQIPLARQITDYGIRSLITVPLQARGVVLGLVNFWRLEETEPFDQEDVSLAEELATRAAVCVDNARRYTREHAMAVTLQRSLLPQTLPAQNALDVAYRYAPAEAGVRGDWFDVIPLPGARVALVVGDVVGHGLHASATMGRLRTAVHNFSTLDLPPDELLGYLDELVARIDQDVIDQDVREGEPGITGATCLYAIYDPVPAQVTIARAGHLGPALVHPEGSVTFPEVPGSPPLGLGGSLPVETAKFQVPEGSRLVLFTDGLVEDRDRDIGAGLALLQRTLAEAPGRDPEQTCQAVFDALQAARHRDDIVLLVARTRVLDPGRVADWDVPSDPAAVAPVRAGADRQLRVWGLEKIGFNTELILSELVTNAIRYGAPPVHVRLLHDRTLICEVTDGSSTSPHVRRAATTDEGGRGLFLVARFAERWGTRYTAGGKVIWTEQVLHDGAGGPGTDLADLLLDQWDEPTL